MPFLDIDKRKWIIGTLEIPVRENIPMSETKWFRETLSKNRKLQAEGKLTEEATTEFEDEWDAKVAEIILGTTVEELELSGISDAQYREVIAEAFIFLKVYGTIEKLKLSPTYGQTTKEPEEKPTKTSRNS